MRFGDMWQLLLTMKLPEGVDLPPNLNCLMSSEISYFGASEYSALRHSVLL